MPAIGAVAVAVAAHLLVRLELVLSLVLPNLVWAKVAVVKVGVLVRGTNTCMLLGVTALPFL